MEFKADKPIYRQIIDYAYGCILSRAWPEGQKIPSVRELAVALAVNSHTVLKAYEELEAKGIIVPRRGMGFFLSDSAYALAAHGKTSEFYDTVLLGTFEQMDRLGITIEEVVERYAEYRRKKNEGTV